MSMTSSHYLLWDFRIDLLSVLPARGPNSSESLLYAINLEILPFSSVILPCLGDFIFRCRQLPLKHRTADTVNCFNRWAPTTIIRHISQTHLQVQYNEVATSRLAYDYRLCLLLGERSKRHTVYDMSYDLWTWVIPEYCTILKNEIISLAYNSSKTCSNSKRITILSDNWMLHGITNYSWCISKIIVENYSHIFIDT